MSPVYLVKVVYRDERSPSVRIVRPEVTEAPHRYPDGSLCLFYPPDRSWRYDSLVALTTVPWTAEWLFFYECWRDAGIWFGDEVPHKGRKKLA